MTQPVTTALAYGVTLIRWPISAADTLQPPAFWQTSLHQLYAQLPFPGLWEPLELNVCHMDHPQLDRFVAERRPCLEDYDPATPGAQVAAGLQALNWIWIGVFPPGWTAGVHTGPERAVSLAHCQAARKVLAHEAGHYYFGRCRYGHAADDDVSRRATAAFRLLRPQQTANEYEDAAETYRAICGDDETRGTFSDGKAFTPRPELRSLVRCLYWLTASLKGCWVASLEPKADWVWFQVWIGTSWRWRCVHATTYEQQEWNGSAWVRI